MKKKRRRRRERKMRGEERKSRRDEERRADLFVHKLPGVLLDVPFVQVGGHVHESHL